MTAKRLWTGSIAEPSFLKRKESTVATTQNLLRYWWGRGVDLRHPAADWAALKKLSEDEWVDTAHVVWSEVTGLCGFSDGSCDNGKCGAGIMIRASQKHLVGSMSAKNAHR